MESLNTAILEKTGASKEQVDKKTAEAQKQIDDGKNVKISSVELGIIFSMFALVCALIFAAIFKRKPGII